MAEPADDPAERRRWLTFALVGGGPTGVELAGQVREVATKTLRKEWFLQTATAHVGRWPVAWGDARRLD